MTATKPSSYAARWRRNRQAATWAAKDWADRLVVRPVIERWLVATARAGSEADHPPQDIRRIYVDISVIANDDAGTGIQRVVRSIHRCLPEVAAPGIEIVPVVVRRRKDGYRTLAGERLVASPHSIFMGLDFATDSVFRYRRDLAEFRRGGGRLWFVLHDILPLSHPHWFTHASCLKYRRWLRVCAALAEGFLCVSEDVAVRLHGVLTGRLGMLMPPPIRVITPGSDISPADRRRDPDSLPRAPGLTAELFSRSALVVGTLEPRKGHADLLDAFDLLWTEEFDIPLVLIGRPGWNTGALQKRIRTHVLFGQKLFWPQDVDDRALQAAYGECRLAVIPSLAEGYGLPLDEAMALGAPVVARDIPVFRRHASAAIGYFGATASAAEIADAIVRMHAAGRNDIPLPNVVQWSHTAAQCLAAIGCPTAPATR